MFATREGAQRSDSDSPVSRDSVVVSRFGFFSPLFLYIACDMIRDKSLEIIHYEQIKAPKNTTEEVEALSVNRD
jgi:hypothetical protein